MSKNLRNKLINQRAVLSRMNFLYQAGILMAGTNNTLSAYYGRLCKRIGTRATQRVHPSIKRNLCKRCSIPVVPGLTTELSSTKGKPKATRKRKSKNKKTKWERYQQSRQTQKQPANATPTTTEPPSRPPIDEPTKPRNIDEMAQFVQKCTVCGFERRFVVNSNYHLWQDEPAALASVSQLEDADAKSKTDQVEQIAAGVS